MIFRKVEIFALWLFLSLLLSCAPTISQNPSESNKPETGRETSISVSKNKHPKESKSSLPKQVEIEEEKLLHLKESPKAKKKNSRKPAQQEAFSKKTNQKLGKEAKQTLDTVGPEQGGSEARESLVLKEKDSLPPKASITPTNSKSSNFNSNDSEENNFPTGTTTSHSIEGDLGNSNPAINENSVPNQNSEIKPLGSSLENPKNDAPKKNSQHSSSTELPIPALDANRAIEKVAGPVPEQKATSPGPSDGQSSSNDETLPSLPESRESVSSTSNLSKTDATNERSEGSSERDGYEREFNLLQESSNPETKNSDLSNLTQLIGVRDRAPVDLETVDSLEPGSVRKSGLGWKAEPIKKNDVFSLDEDSIKTIEFENSRKEYGALKDYLYRGGGNSRMDSNVTKFRALDDLKVWNKDKSKTWDEGLGDEGGNRSFSEVYQWIKRKGKKNP